MLTNFKSIGKRIICVLSRLKINAWRVAWLLACSQGIARAALPVAVGNAALPSLAPLLKQRRARRYTLPKILEKQSTSKGRGLTSEMSRARVLNQRVKAAAPRILLVMSIPALVFVRQKPLATDRKRRVVKFLYMTFYGFNFAHGQTLMVKLMLGRFCRERLTVIC